MDYNLKEVIRWTMENVELTEKSLGVFMVFRILTEDFYREPSRPEVRDLDSGRSGCAPGSPDR